MDGFHDHESLRQRLRRRLRENKAAKKEGTKAFKRPRRWLPNREEIQEDVKQLLEIGGDPDLMVYGDSNGGFFVAEDFGLESFRDLGRD